MSDRIKILHSLGQSLWFDNIQRRLLENGYLDRLIKAGDLRGMTSNPSIFNQAISQTHDYDSAIQTMALAGYDSNQILEQLIIEDIRSACDLFASLYHDTRGRDGYVSLEVSPFLAHDTKTTLSEVRRLWNLVDRPNVMIKIPATAEGLSAIRQATADGINVNITLIFSLDRYNQVMEAYLAGLEDRLAKGLPINTIESVASFFISRIDTKVDKQLDEIIANGESLSKPASVLLGKAAIASGKLAYNQFQHTFGGERFSKLRARGAHVQRPLWASTSTKNPHYPDTLYVDNLIGAETVNTVPEKTLDAFRDHGTPRLTLGEELDASRQVFNELAALGIFINQVTLELENEGVAAFSDAFVSLQKTVEERRQTAVKEIGPLAKSIAKRVTQLEGASVLSRLQAKDPSLWTDDLSGRKEIMIRMGWLDLPKTSRSLLPEINELIREVKEAGYTHALLLGMGGSSLAPEVMRLIFGVAHGGLDLSILDSTDPAQVTSASSWSPVEKTLYIVSSKSGGTAEVNAFFDYFWKRATRKLGKKVGDHFIAITDPGTSLEKLGRGQGFRHVFLVNPEVGGRFSALTAFGLVPAGLLGLNFELLLDRADWMARQCTSEIASGRSPGLVLGAVVGEAVLEGRDKLTIITSEDLAPFGAWLEQLIAESSGKQGVGIVPINGEPLASPDVYGKDRLFVYFRSTTDKQLPAKDKKIAQLVKTRHPVITYNLTDPYDLGVEFYRWEVAIAIACSILQVNAFDQPDVQDSKTRTIKRIDSYHQTGNLNEGQPFLTREGVKLFSAAVHDPGKNSREIIDAFLAQGKPGDYVAINAYLPRTASNRAILQRLRLAVQKRTHFATTVGFGPRFLHSTGQLHKGGKNNGLFLQITAEPTKDVAIPNEGITFGVLERAQALGDLEALQARNRRILRVHFQNLDAMRNTILTLL